MYIYIYIYIYIDRAELIRSLDRYIDFEDKSHSGPLRPFRAQGFFFDLFLASFPEGPKISFFSFLGRFLKSQS